MGKKLLGVKIVESDWMPKTKAMFINAEQVVLIKGLPHPNPIIRLAQRCVSRLKCLVRGKS